MINRPTRSMALPFQSVAVAVGTLAVALLASVSQAQTPTPPFDAVVVQANTPIRSGAGRAYYEVGSLDVGARVSVEDNLFGWYKIQCPDGVFCFVERKNVNVRGDGSLGVIETDGTPINAAHITKGPADSYRNLLKLDAGDTVEIVAEVANAYKIKPPSGAFVYLPPGAVKPAADLEPAPQPVAPAEPEPVAPTQPEPQVEAAPIVVAPPAPKPEPAPVVVNPPVAPEVPQVIESPATTEEVSPTTDAPAPIITAEALLNDPTVEVPFPDIEVQTQASNEKLRAVEVAMLPYLSLPADQQPIAKMVRGYADAAQIERLSDNDLAIIQARLTQIERNRELAVALAEADAVVAQTQTSDNAVPTSLPPAPPVEAVVSVDAPQADSPAPSEAPTPEAIAEAVEQETPAAPETPTTPAAPVVTSGYDAIGILTASTVHTGNNQPVLFRLLDPNGRRTVAYLEPGEQIDTVQMIGRVVGIIGESVYDPTTKLNLIRPSRVDILGAQ